MTLAYRDKHAVTRPIWGFRPGDVVTISNAGRVCHRKPADLDPVCERWVQRTFGGLASLHPIPTLADYEFWKKTIEQARESQILEDFEAVGSFLRVPA